VSDSEGKLLARTDGAGAKGDDLGGLALVAEALRGQSAAGVLTDAGRLYHAVAIPIGTPGQDLAGVIVSGYAMGAELAEELKRTTSTEVAFASVALGKPQLVASTLSRPDEVAPILEFAAANLGAGSEPHRLDISGMSYLGAVSPIVTPGGERAGGLVVLRSIAREMATYRKLRDSLLLIGLVAVAFAFAVSYILARRITEPLLGLVKVAESVRDGEYGVDVKTTGGDEVGTLAAAIRAMVRELRDKAELERFVAELQASPERATAAMSSSGTVAARSVAAAGTSATPAGGGGGVTGRSGAEPRVGELFANRYEIVEVIGTGGMGKVYKARDRELDEMVALKTIRKDVLGSDPAALERFKQEIKLARKATHKNIMRTFDFGDAGGVHFLTMEYVSGLTLRDLVRRQKDVPLGIALRIARQVCTGLYAAHDAGIIHRDVKGQNILIQPNGELKIMDFGIARPHGASNLTSVGAIVGTPEYMAPEQALGKEADFRSDIYSAGIVLYEIFTGRVPFTGRAPLEVAMMHVQAIAPPPIQVKPSLPPEIDAIIRKMIEKDPGKRFQTFAEVYAALSKVAAPPAAKAA
jgi:serine/threonine-protein kinase